MKNKYFIEVIENIDGIKSVTYYNNGSHMSKVPQFFNDKMDANNESIKLNKYIYKEYPGKLLYFTVKELNSEMSHLPGDLDRVLKLINKLKLELESFRDQLDESIDNCDFDKSRDLIDDIESDYNSIRNLSSELKDLQNLINNYKSWI